MRRRAARRRCSRPARRWSGSRPAPRGRREQLARSPRCRRGRACGRPSARRPARAAGCARPPRARRRPRRPPRSPGRSRARRGARRASGRRRRRSGPARRLVMPPLRVGELGRCMRKRAPTAPASSVPPISAARSRMPTMPWPPLASSAALDPSSGFSTVSSSSSAPNATSTVALPAPWRAAFVSASWRIRYAAWSTRRRQRPRPAATSRRRRPGPRPGGGRRASSRAASPGGGSTASSSSLSVVAQDAHDLVDLADGLARDVLDRLERAPGPRRVVPRSRAARPERRSR